MQGVHAAICQLMCLMLKQWLTFLETPFIKSQSGPIFPTKKCSLVVLEAWP